MPWPKSFGKSFRGFFRFFFRFARLAYPRPEGRGLRSAKSDQFAKQGFLSSKRAPQSGLPLQVQQGLGRRIGIGGQAHKMPARRERLGMVKFHFSAVRARREIRVGLADWLGVNRSGGKIGFVGRIAECGHGWVLVVVAWRIWVSGERPGESKGARREEKTVVVLVRDDRRRKRCLQRRAERHFARSSRS